MDLQRRILTYNNRCWSHFITSVFVISAMTCSMPASAWRPMTTAWKKPKFAKSSTNRPKYYIQVTLTNSQTSATQTGLPVKVTINSNTNSTKYSATLTNANWQTEDGTVLKSWLESGGTNTSTSSVYWVKLNSAIPSSGGKKIIYQVIYDTTVNVFDGTNTGAEPQFTGTYGQYDNGAQVFSLYDNFAGTTLNAMWTKYNTARGTYTQNNSMSIKVTSTSFGGNFGMFASLTPNSAGTYVRMKSTCVASGDGLAFGIGNGTVAGSSGMQNGYAFIAGSSFNTKISLWKITTGSSTALVQTVSDSFTSGNTYVTESNWSGNSLSNTNVTNAHTTSTTDATYTLTSQNQVLMAVLTSVSNVEFKFFYYIAAISPPSGVAPSTSVATVNLYGGGR